MSPAHICDIPLRPLCRCLPAPQNFWLSRLNALQVWQLFLKHEKDSHPFTHWGGNNRCYILLGIFSSLWYISGQILHHINQWDSQETYQCLQSTVHVSWFYFYFFHPQNRPSVITCAPTSNRNCNLSHCHMNGCSPSPPADQRKTNGKPLKKGNLLFFCSVISEKHCNVLWVISAFLSQEKMWHQLLVVVFGFD